MSSSVYFAYLSFKTFAFGQRLEVLFMTHETLSTLLNDKTRHALRKYNLMTKLHFTHSREAKGLTQSLHNLHVNKLKLTFHPKITSPHTFLLQNQNSKRKLCIAQVLPCKQKNSMKQTKKPSFHLFTPFISLLSCIAFYITQQTH